MSLVQEGYLFKRGGLLNLLLTTIMYGQGLFPYSAFLLYSIESIRQCATHSMTGRSRFALRGRGLVKIGTHEAGDVVKRWNLRYFMLLVGAQPTLVYYRKVRGSICSLTAEYTAPVLLRLGVT